MGTISGNRESERRNHQRIKSNGHLIFKAYYSLHDRSPEDNVNSLQKFYDKLYGSAEIIDECGSGMRIKTSTPLQQGYLLEMENLEHPLAMVRWGSKSDEDEYEAGIMYIEATLD
ncbi:MAG: hypothetical protein JXR79_04130 [Nitrospirae bacterium]|nr:hypothetical protein [Nitrospirota bacterium]